MNKSLWFSHDLRETKNYLIQLVPLISHTKFHDDSFSATTLYLFWPPFCFHWQKQIKYTPWASYSQKKKKRRRSTTLPLNKHITNANANMNMDSILSFVLLHSTFCKILLLIFNVTFNLDNHENTVAMNKCIIKQKISYQENFKIAIDILKRW